MTVNEAKEILLTTRLSPTVREALNVLFPDLQEHNTLLGEEWRDVVGENGVCKGEYQVSSLGRVRSFKAGKVKILKPVYDGKGYEYAGIHKNGKQKKIHVHTLVAKAFLPNPENKPFVNHIDGNKSNNRVENLEWVTPSENIQHALKMGLMKRNYSLTDDQVREIRRDCIPNDRKHGFTAFAEKFNVPFIVIKKAYYQISYKDVE